MTARESHHRHERLGDQLLTALTILLSVLLFVAAPLQANGVLSAPDLVDQGLLTLPAPDKKMKEINPKRNGNGDT
jgi:hypothetical protein